MGKIWYTAEMKNTLLFSLTVLTLVIEDNLCVSDLPMDGENKNLHIDLSGISINQFSKVDENLQECSGSPMKHSFPDVDYSLLGYNILKGYPLADGHDPGFTYPIFIANYTSGLQSADCRYSIPNGMIMIPDISCTTSFTSTVIQTSSEFSDSLSASVNFDVSAKIAAFKASAEYKKTSSSISSGEYIFIISSADCTYYFSKLNQYTPPKFHPNFEEWIYKLDSSNERSTYMEFLDYYGTHFPFEVTFGARYVYQHKMQSTTYKTELSNNVNVAASASYSGLYSVSGGFSMETSQREAASSFMSKVTTTTVTTGASPPSNGDSMTWASTVKESPVPVKYKLESIDKLFVSRFMKSVNVNYTRIAENIKHFSSKYCQELQQQGLIDICDGDTGELTLKSTRLFGNSTIFKTVLLKECIAECLAKIDCVAISFCKSCAASACRLFDRSSTLIYSNLDENWSSIVIRTNINAMLKVHKTAINGFPRGEQTKRVTSQFECAMRCFDDIYCIAFTYCYCPDRVSNCHLFGENMVNHMYEKEDTSSYIMSNYIRNITRQGATYTFSRLVNEITLASTKLLNPTETVSLNDFQSCLNYCLEKLNCTAITFCQTKRLCDVFIGIELDSRASTDEQYESLILRSNIPTARNFQIEHADISGGHHPESVAVVESKASCIEKCVQNDACVAFSYSTCTDDNRPFQCKLYSEDHIKSIERKWESVTVFLGNKRESLIADNTEVGFTMDSSRLFVHTKSVTSKDYRTCKKECIKATLCIAVSYDFNGKKCYKFIEFTKDIKYGTFEKSWSTAFVRSHIQKSIELKNTELESYCKPINSFTTKTSDDCLQKCFNKEECAAISFSQNDYNCKLYQENEMKAFKARNLSNTFIVSKKLSALSV